MVTTKIAPSIPLGSSGEDLDVICGLFDEARESEVEGLLEEALTSVAAMPVGAIVAILVMTMGVSSSRRRALYSGAEVELLARGRTDVARLLAGLR